MIGFRLVVSQIVFSELKLVLKKYEFYFRENKFNFEKIEIFLKDKNFLFMLFSKWITNFIIEIKLKFILKEI
jgi:hypothetical protein